jgi:hypothetical protein
MLFKAHAKDIENEKPIDIQGIDNRNYEKNYTIIVKKYFFCMKIANNA